MAIEAGAFQIRSAGNRQWQRRCGRAPLCLDDGRDNDSGSGRGCGGAVGGCEGSRTRRERPWFTGWRQLSSFVATSYDVGDGGRLRCWCRVVLCMDFGFFLEKGPPVWCPLAIGTCAVAMR
ncbi:hypothetical protein OsJ_11624 [Oryza sativa Japonica Group]|uniref:Uncharacterized protein n=1 Tax=Oryza sativa subsp. japonica TaxID=39947 RepID=A3AK39_ORYSJ|nr:hypothetical protein OsJ_11624 [Oryza sativa Japonica Group]